MHAAVEAKTLALKDDLCKQAAVFSSIFTEDLAAGGTAAARRLLAELQVAAENDDVPGIVRTATALVDEVPDSVSRPAKGCMPHCRRTLSTLRLTTASKHLIRRQSACSQSACRLRGGAQKHCGRRLKNVESMRASSWCVH